MWQQLQTGGAGLQTLGSRPEDTPSNLATSARQMPILLTWPIGGVAGWPPPPMPMPMPIPMPMPRPMPMLSAPPAGSASCCNCGMLPPPPLDSAACWYDGAAAVATARCASRMAA